MQYRLLILFKCERFRVLIYSVSLLDKHLIDFELDGLPFDNLLLACVLGHQPINICSFGLADTMGSIHCLQIYLRVEITVVQNDMVCGDEIDSEAACSR